MLFMGIDAGSQGVRVVAADEQGSILASCSAAYQRINISPEPGYFEQSPDDWCVAVTDTVRGCVARLKRRGIEPGDIAAISVDGTSGTILPVGSNKNPLMNAVMYNDPRSAAQAEFIHGKASALEARCGYRFNASFGLPKILWIKENAPDIFNRTRIFLHQADYIIGRLCGEYFVTDYANALKTGYDISKGGWPDEAEHAGIDTCRLPDVVAPGTRIGRITQEFARETGLQTSTYVVAGATDGYASALAAGAVKPGEWASIIGTTLVIKGVTKNLLIDRNGSAYSHMMPSGAYMAGGASNVGGICLNAKFDKDNFDTLNSYVDELSPTGVIAYPLVGRGERFPFHDPDAQGFMIGDTRDRKRLYAALMEGVGFAEKLSLDTMAGLGAEVGSVINTSGGGCRSDEWLRIRANILNRQLKVPNTIEAAMGSALLAASDYFGSLELAAEKMIRFDKVVEPDGAKARRYEGLYAAFMGECGRRYGIEGTI